MFELSIIDGPQKGHSLALRDGSSFVVGTAPNADLRIGGDAAPEHAAIKPLRNGGFGIKALDSAVLVNGESVSAAPLKPGDQIEIGDATMRFDQRSDKNPIPERLGGFEIKGMLGKGGMGLVYRARQVSLDREVALKVLADKHTRDPEFVSRFQAEAKHAAQLHHPNVVQVFDVDHDGDTYFYSMELMHQGSVEGRLKKAGRLSVDDALSITLDAARGLAFAKETGLVHRDIKPDNLMVDRHGNVKLADLGLARAEDEEEGKIVGTPHFMPPEQIQRKPLDHRSDLYALGCTLFRMLTGRTPFQGANVKAILRGHLREVPPRADEVADGIPSDIADIVARLLEKDPADRYQSAHELIEDIESLQSAERRGSPVVWIVIAAVAVLGVIGFLVFSNGGNKNNDGPQVVIQSDPEAANRERELREANADRERLRLIAELDGEALAQALATFAADPDYAGTEAASLADTRSQEILADLRAREEAERERATEINQAVQAFQAEIQKVLGPSDGSTAQPTASALSRALELCEAPTTVEGVDASVLGTRAFDASLASTRERVRSAIESLVGGPVTAFDEAMTEQDVEAARTELSRLDDLLAEEAGWPLHVYRDRDVLLAEQQRRAQRLSAMVSATANEREASSWAALTEALAATDAGAAQAIRRGDFTAAVTGLQSASGDITATKTRAVQQALIGACTEAGRYLASIEASLGELSFEDNDGPRPFTAIERTPQLTVVLGPVARTESDGRRIPAVQFPDFAWPKFPAQDRDREMFLGLLSYAEAFVRSPRIVEALLNDPDSLRADDRAWLFGDPPPARLDTLESSTATPTDTILRFEFRAARLLHSALRALASGRTTAGRNRLEQLLRDRDPVLLRRLL